jgi:hypothetical protein
MASTYSSITTFITTICSIVAQEAERKVNGLLLILGKSEEGLEGTTKRSKKKETTP